MSERWENAHMKLFPSKDDIEKASLAKKVGLLSIIVSEVFAILLTIYWLFRRG